MGELRTLPNIGEALEKQLNEAGINSIDTLKAIGSKEAWIKIRSKDPTACYNRLCALEGAIRNIRWFDLPDDVKEDLKIFYTSFK